MKKILSIIIIIVLSTILGLAYNISTNLSLRLLEATDDIRPLREDLNYNFELVDDIFNDVTFTEFSYLDGVTSAIQTQLDAVGSGAVDTSGTPVDNDIAVFTDLNTIEGLNYAELKAVLDLEIGTDVQAYDAALANISGLTYVSPSFIKLTANDTYAVRTISEVITDLALDSDDLSDVASIAMLDETEEITGVWTFTDNPIIRKVSDTATAPPLLNFQKRDATGDTDVDQGDFIGKMNFYGWHGAGYQLGATIRVIVDADPGDTTDMPARICFLTSPDGTASPVLRMLIDCAGNIKIGDGAWTNYIQITAAGVLTLEGTANIEGVDATEMGYLSTVSSNVQDQFGLRYLKTEMDDSSELAGIISDETGTGKVVFNIAPVLYQNVTTSATTNTLTVAEAGLILVSDAHTETLPTALGNAGLTYHFVKTDWDYDLITLEGDGAETFNYENSTGSPNLTYLRLNTPLAEVTMVSDGTNWQVINEAMGQNPSCAVYLGSDMNDLISGEVTLVLLDTEEYDIGNNFNTTTHKYICPVTGTYWIRVQATHKNTVTDKKYSVAFKYNETTVAYAEQFITEVAYVNPSVNAMKSFSKDDEITMWVWNSSGVNTSDIHGSVASDTYMHINLIQKN